MKYKFSNLILSFFVSSFIASLNVTILSLQNKYSASGDEYLLASFITSLASTPIGILNIWILEDEDT
jgi:hypothetical protein